MTRHSYQLAERSRKRESRALGPSHTALLELLRDLASALLPRGMTPRAFAELARSAFVQAAAEKSRLQNGRVNQSRVAAQTGLSRADVKRLLDLDSPSHLPNDSPVQRVLNGWHSDSSFTDRRGRPKRTLRISGRLPTFKHLAEKYAGDVPYRAVLNELGDLGVVGVTGQHVELLGSDRLQRRNDFSFLAPLTAPLKDGLRIVSASIRTRSSPLIQRLHLPVNTEVDLAFVKDRCIERTTSMLEGLSHSTSDRVMLQKKQGRATYSFTVTVLLAENSPKKPQRERKVRRGRDRHG